MASESFSVPQSGANRCVSSVRGGLGSKDHIRFVTPMTPSLGPEDTFPVATATHRERSKFRELGHGLVHSSRWNNPS